MDKEKRTDIAKTIGGQAIIEGVMMRGKTMYALAVRNVVSKEIVVEKSNLNNLNNKSKFLKLPFIRGAVSFFQSMILGFKIIMRSATLSGLEDGEELEEKTKFEIWLEKKFGDKLSDYIIYFSLFISLLFSTALFIVLPVGIGKLLSRQLEISYMGISIIEGITRISIFLIYIYLVSKTKDVKRIFMYHGAEHKTITCFEKGDELTIENVKKHSRLHKRCGTNFLVIVFIVSIIIFTFLQTNNVFIRVLSKIILVPAVAGISYEIIRWLGKTDNILSKMISYPGMSLQKITTQEPTGDMIETAIKSLQAVLENDEGLDENEDV